jgi:hypothetical protein
MLTFLGPEATTNTTEPKQYTNPDMNMDKIEIRISAAKAIMKVAHSRDSSGNYLYPTQSLQWSIHYLRRAGLMR